MPRVRRIDLGLRSKGGTYTLVLGVVIGLLAAGLGIPFVFGEPLDTVQSSANSLQPPDAAASSPDDGTQSQSGTGTPGATEGGAAVGPTGAGGGSGGLAPASGPVRGGAALTASDRGVTPDAITVAFLLVDLGGVSQAGFSVPGFDPKLQKGYAMAFVDRVNAGGGVLGRKIDPRFFSYDPTNPSSGQAACRAATQDTAIFAAVDIGSALDFPGQLCFTEQNRTPLITFGGFGTTQEMYAKSSDRLITVLPSGVRSLANTAQELVRQGLLKGKRIGIVDRDFPGTLQTVTDGMVATLDRLGYEVTYRSDLSSDNGVAASQIPVAVQQMRSNGVDAVILLMDFITATAFVQNADRSGYTPNYFVSDFGAMTNDISLSAMPGSFRAVGITTMRTGEWRANLPEPEIDAACQAIYATSTGQAAERYNSNSGGVLQACGMVDLFIRAAVGAGPELTRNRWTSSMQRVGAIAYPNFGGVSFAARKFDGADAIRAIEFKASCAPPSGGSEGPCWMPRGSFRPPHY